jgi:hypothetical protein
MKTDDLIGLLSQDLPPARRGVVMQNLLSGLVLGGIVSALLLIFVLKPRSDLHAVMQTLPFWTRFGYTALLALIGFVIVARQARAAADSRMPIMALAGPVVALIVLAAVQMSEPYADTARLVMGKTWTVCPWLILFLAVPLYGAIAFFLRNLAPTRLELAGGAAGLLAGATAATIYGFHCHEMAAPFILIWYTLGILVSAGLGALAGPRLLRW